MLDAWRPWVAKAEADLWVAETLMAAAGERAVDEQFDGVCFHAQQCVEKSMKAVLVLHGITPRKTHDLPSLAAEIVSVVPDYLSNVVELREITNLGIRVRYPETTVDRKTAKRLVSKCRELRASLLTLLPHGSK